jgi:hypothetical protein
MTNRKHTIETVNGRRVLVRRFGTAGWYALTEPTPEHPEGELWTFSLSGDWVPVPPNGRAVCQAWARSAGIEPTTEAAEHGCTSVQAANGEGAYCPVCGECTG